MTADRSRDPDALPSVVRDAIARANVEDGSDAQVARLAARVGPMLGLSASMSLIPGAAKAAAAPKAGLIAGKLALVKATFASGVVAGVVGGTIAYRAASSSSNEDVGRRVDPSTQVAAPRVAAPRVASPGVASSAMEPPVPAVESAGDPAPASAGPEPPAALEPPRPSRAAPAPSAGALNEEARLLKRAGALIGSDPAGALSAADEHRRRFPTGALTHERDVLAIRALIALGRRSEASQRLRRFERAFPSSPHLARFRETLGK